MLFWTPLVLCVMVVPVVLAAPGPAMAGAAVALAGIKLAEIITARIRTWRNA